MTEGRVGYLCNIAFNLSSKNNTHKMLRSYYLMRCNQMTKGYGLPPKYFSTKARCPHCYSDWTQDSDVKIQPLKHSKKKRHRIRPQKESEHSKNNSEQRRIQQNEMVRVCSFCKRSTKTRLIKPDREYKATTPKDPSTLKAKDQTKQEKMIKKKETMKKKLTSKQDANQKINVVNYYTNAFDVLSLKNDKNTLSSTIKVPPKVIKNNKKRKDKFAGLCQKAVLASAKLKDEKEKQLQHPSQNRLNLFLKPSQG